MAVAVEDQSVVRNLISELVKRINDDTRRIRLLEQRVDRTDTNIGSLEENALSQLNDLKIGIERISDKILQLSEKFSRLENEIAKLNKEFGKTATKVEVKQLESFIDLINPVTSKFITKDELERRFEERLIRPRKA